MNRLISNVAFIFLVALIIAFNAYLIVLYVENVLEYYNVPDHQDLPESGFHLNSTIGLFLIAFLSIIIYLLFAIRRNKVTLFLFILFLLSSFGNILFSEKKRYFYFHSFNAINITFITIVILLLIHLFINRKILIPNIELNLRDYVIGITGSVIAGWLIHYVVTLNT